MTRDEHAHTEAFDGRSVVNDGHGHGVNDDHVPDDDHVNSHLASKDRAISKGVEELPGARHLDSNQPDIDQHIDKVNG